MRIALGAIVVLVAACSSKKDEPPPAPKTPYERAALLMKGFAPNIEQLGTDLSTTKGDCKKLAATVNAFATTHRPTIDLMQKSLLELPRDEQQKLMSEQAGTMGRLAQMITSSSYQCPHDPDVHKALIAAGFIQNSPTPPPLPLEKAE